MKTLEDKKMLEKLFAAALMLAPMDKGNVTEQYKPAPPLSPLEKIYIDLAQQSHQVMFDQQANLENYELAVQDLILVGMVTRDLSGAEKKVNPILHEYQQERDGYIADVEVFARSLSSIESKIESKIESTSPSSAYTAKKAEFHQVLDQHRMNLPQYCMRDRIMKGLAPDLEEMGYTPEEKGNQPTK